MTLQTELELKIAELRLKHAFINYIEEGEHEFEDFDEVEAMKELATYVYESLLPEKTYDAESGKLGTMFPDEQMFRQACTGEQWRNECIEEIQEKAKLLGIKQD